MNSRIPDVSLEADRDSDISLVLGYRDGGGDVVELAAADSGRVELHRGEV